MSKSILYKSQTIVDEVFYGEHLPNGALNVEKVTRRVFQDGKMIHEESYSKAENKNANSTVKQFLKFCLLKSIALMGSKK